MYAPAIEAPNDFDPTEGTASPASGGWILFIGVWLVLCLIGGAVAVLAKQVMLGAAIMAIPTAIGVFSSPTFALCCIAMVLSLSGSVNLEGFLTADRVVGGLAALGILFHCKFLGQGVFTKGSPLIPMFVLAGWAATSALWAPNHPFAFFSSLTILQLAIWGLAVWNAVAYRGNFIWPVRCYVLAMFVVVMRLYFSGGLSRIAQAVGVASRLTLAGTNDVDINPNDFAEFLVGGFFFAVYLMLRDPAKSLRLVWAVCSFVFPVMVLLTGARSCLAGLIAAMVVTGFTLHNFLRSRGMLVGLLLAAMLLGVGANIVFSSRYAKTEAVKRLVDSKRRGKSVDNRFMLMRHGVKSIIQRPLLGTGYKNYVFANRGEKWTIHNDIMLLTAELGFPGFCMIMAFFWKLTAGFMATKSPAEKWLLRSTLIFFFVAGQAHSCFANKAFWFFPICAAAIAHRSRMVEQARTAQAATAQVFMAGPPAYPTLHSRLPTYA